MMLTSAEQMAQDLAGGETRQVEFKRWMDITKGDGAQKIARSISALSNSGGGRLYFGVDDDGTAMPSSVDFPLEMFSQEVIHRLLKRHVGELECQVIMTDFQGSQYPMVRIPRHGEVPWIAPDQHGNAVGVYIRSIKPETVLVSSRQQWEELLDSLMEVREQKSVRRLEDGIVARTQDMAGLVASELKGLLDLRAGRSSRPDWQVIESLAKATRLEFTAQLEKIVFEGRPPEKQKMADFVKHAALNNVIDGYALLSEDGDLVHVQQLGQNLRAASNTMREVSYDGWTDFLTLSDPRVSPRSSFWNIDGYNVTGVEGIHHDQRRIFSYSLDYWRAYANGVFTTCKTFDEDVPGDERKPKQYLATNMFFLRMHAILAHAGSISRNVPSAKKLAIFSEPIGIKNRKLHAGTGGDRQVIGPGVGSDSYPFRMVISAEELASDYIGTLAKVLNSIMEPFADRHHLAPFTTAVVQKHFEMFNDRLVTIHPLPTASNHLGQAVLP